MSKDKLLVNLIRKSVGLPVGPSSCCGAPVPQPAGCTCNAGVSPAATPLPAKDCCDKSEDASPTLTA